MSRIGNKPINLSGDISVAVDERNIITVKGPKGTLSETIDLDINLKIDDGMLILSRPTEQKRHKAMHGLYRSLVSNMIEGVSKGYKKELELVGVGFKATAQNNILELNLGHSHSIFFQVPSELSVLAETKKGKSPTVTIEGIDKQLIGQVAAQIRSLRKIEPYKGKGIKFKGEIIRRKAGKTAAK